MDKIREQMSKLSELDNDALNALSELILSEFEIAESSEVSPEVVENMTELVNAFESLKSELTSRESQAQELSDMKEAAVQRIRGEEAADESVDEALEEDVEDVVEDIVEDDEDDELSNKNEASVEVVETTEESPESTFTNELEVEEDASAELATQEENPTPEVETELAAEAVAEEAGVEETELSQREDLEAEMNASTENQGPNDVQAPESHRPVVVGEAVTTARATTTIVAGGDIRNVSAGSTLPSMGEVAKAMTQRIGDIRHTNGGDGEQFSVATIQIEYPEDRHLTGGSSDADKIAAVTSPQAIVAAGGFCAPVEVSYDIYGFGTTNRPVKESLAGFSADRGGIRYTSSPKLGDLSGAVSLWTLQDDKDAATAGAPDPTKPCLRVVCGEEIVVNTDAIPLCLTFGNLQSRAFPEMVERNNELALIEHARYAETRLLTRIGALSTSVSAAATLGAARDFFAQIGRAHV